MIDFEAIGAYKRKLMNYRFYENQIKKCNDKLLVLRTQREGVHAIRYDGEKVQGSQDPYLAFIKEDNLREAIISEENKLSYFQQLLNEINSDLQKMEEPISSAIKKIYCLRISTLAEEATLLYLGKITLRRKIDREITKILEK